MLNKIGGIKPKTFEVKFENISVKSIRNVAKSYKNHRSIAKIKQEANVSDVSDSEGFFFKTVNETEIKNLLRSLDIKKVSGHNTIKLGLINLSITQESHQNEYYTQYVYRIY